jgi:hypothetical protein
MNRIEGVKCPWCGKQVPNIKMREDTRVLDIPCIWCAEIITVSYFPNLAQRLIVERFDENVQKPRRLLPHMRRLTQKIRKGIGK